MNSGLGEREHGLEVVGGRAAGHRPATETSDTGPAPLLALCGGDATRPDQARLEAAAAGFHAAFESLGLDMSDPNLEGTERRVVRSYRELFAGLYAGRPPELRTFPNPERYGQMVAVTDIPFHSLCAHHLLPFFGRVHVAYLPKGRLVGLSKFARVVEYYARRPQIQERLTVQIVGLIEERLRPAGAMVVVQARHFCMEMRGVAKAGATTTTSAIRGAFTEEPTRQEFLGLLRAPLGREI